MSKKLLSIGEISKLKGISVKSLRYYDRIGILKPAYVNQETGYRYYIPEQMIMLDIISLCLTFHLPLKTLSWSCENGQPVPDLKQLIEDGQEKALAKLREEQKTLRLSQDLLEQIDRLEHLHEERELYDRYFPARLMLTEPWVEGKDKGRSYIRKAAALHERARAAGLTVLTQQGIIFDYRSQKQMVYLAVEGDYSGEDSRIMPAGCYHCMGLREIDMEKVPEIMEGYGIQPAYSICMNTDIYDYCLAHHLHWLEVQSI